MGDASRGPVSSMPGSSHKLPEDSVCDTHEDRPAVRRIQGETDSFGCEYVDMCQECLDAYHAYREAELNREKVCEWCRQSKTGVHPHRDFEEGSAGRLYDVCGDCISKENDRLGEELAEYERERGDFDNDSFHDVDPSELEPEPVPDWDAIWADAEQVAQDEVDASWNNSDGQGA